MFRHPILGLGLRYNRRASGSETGQHRGVLPQQYDVRDESSGFSTGESGRASAAHAAQFVPSSAFAVLPASASRHSFFDGLADVSGNDERKLAIFRKGKPFVAHDHAFLKLLGPSPNLRIIARQPGKAFAHEAGIYVPDRDEVWFTSNLVRAEDDVEVHISKISLGDLRVERIEVPHVGMGNGGCLYQGKLLFCEQGTMSTPSQLILVDPVQPSGSSPILDNFHGRRFNSINDVITLPHLHNSTRSTIWFTDPTYGYEQGYRPRPELPSQVYCFDPDTGDIRAVADGFDHPNGICFSPDGLTCYITDTCHIHGTGVIDPAKTSTMYAVYYSLYLTLMIRYAFDVVWCGNGSSATPQLRNRRLFAFADSGVPDGSMYQGGARTDR